MLDVLFSRWELVLSATSLAWVRRPVWANAGAQVVAQTAVDGALQGAERLDALSAFLDASAVRNRLVRVCLDDSWLYSAQVPALRNAQRWQDVQSYTAMSLQEAFELSQPLKVVVLSSQDAAHNWACGLRQSDLEALQALLSARRLFMGSCVPQWSVVWREVSAKVEHQDAVLLAGPEVGHLVLLQQGQLQAVRNLPHGLDSAAGERLELWVASEFRRLGLAAPARVGWVGEGPAPQGRSMRFEPLAGHADVLSVWGVEA